MMKVWFLAGVWSTIVVLILIYSATTGNIGGMICASILCSATAFLAGLAIGDTEKK